MSLEPFVAALEAFGSEEGLAAASIQLLGSIAASEAGGSPTQHLTVGRAW